MKLLLESLVESYLFRESRQYNEKELLSKVKTWILYYILDTEEGRDNIPFPSEAARLNWVNKKVTIKVDSPNKGDVYLLLPSNDFILSSLKVYKEEDSYEISKKKLSSFQGNILSGTDWYAERGRVDNLYNQVSISLFKKDHSTIVPKPKHLYYLSASRLRTTILKQGIKPRADSPLSDSQRLLLFTTYDRNLFLRVAQELLEEDFVVFKIDTEIYENFNLTTDPTICDIEGAVFTTSAIPVEALSFVYEGRIRT